MTAYPQTVPPSTTPGRRVARASLDRGVRAGDLPGSAPCRGAGTLRSRSVGRMRQIRCIIADLPRISALRIGSPAGASDAPLQGGPILAGLPRIPPTGRLSDPYRSPNSGSRQRTPAAGADGPGGGRRRALVDPGAGRRGAAVVGPWSGAPRASVGAPTRSAEIRGWSEPQNRSLRHSRSLHGYKKGGRSLNSSGSLSRWTRTSKRSRGVRCSLAEATRALAHSPARWRE